MASNQDVAFQPQWILDNKLRYAMIDALLGGTETMREAGETYLPKFTKEDNDSYKIRLSKATLLPALKETIKNMTGRVFSKSIDRETIKLDNIYLDDFDRAGNDIDKFGEKAFYEAMAYGLTYAVCDYSGSDNAKTVEQEKASGARPYSYHVSAKQLMDIRFGIVDGQEVIKLFKYQRTVEESEGNFKVNTIQEIVLFTVGKVDIYRQVEGKNEWTLHKTIELKINGNALNYVPVIELKFARTPPLIDLAYLNVKHWQSQSDQDNILHTARVPMMVASGLNDANDLTVGNGAISIPRDADLKYLEHTGASIESGQKSLDKLEDHMSMAGAKLLARTKNSFTDIQAKNEAKKDVSELMLYGMLFDNFMTKVLDYYGRWLKKYDAGSVNISTSIDDELAGDFSLSDLLSANREDVLSKETIFATLKSRGAIDSNLEWEKELERIQRERATMSFDINTEE